MYLYVYGPEGIHASPTSNRQRRHFHRLSSVDERLRYVDDVYERRWQDDLSLGENLKNVARNLLKRPKGSKHGVLDLLEPFYNWVIPLDVIEGWAGKGGFSSHTLLNTGGLPRCGFHVLFQKLPDRLSSASARRQAGFVPSAIQPKHGRTVTFTRPARSSSACTSSASYRFSIGAEKRSNWSL